MNEHGYEVVEGSHGSKIRVAARGNSVLHSPRLNRGTAFTEEERKSLGLVGLLPSRVTPLEAQLHRVYEQFKLRDTDLQKFAYLQSLRERNAVLFYRLLSEHIEEMLPIVYTPTVGEAIEQFSHWYNRLAGIFLSIDRPDEIEESLRAYGRNPEDIDLIVVTDSEGILGIGDQGVGGVQICIGKKSLYTAAAGIDPDRMLPIVLDVGTDNLALLNDELYIGVRHSRVRGERYDAFIDDFVQVATRVFPNAMVHWEDFGASNAHRILNRYRDEICTFNDDVQGTAAVVLAAALAGVKAKGQRMRDQTVVIHGAGTAGVGIADLMRDIMVREGLTQDEAQSRFYGLGSRGLLHAGLGDKIRPFQVPYARSEAEIKKWTVENRSNISLADVVKNAKPTILIGTSAQAGCFTESIVRSMTASCPQPIIMPLSNPTRQSEAVPGDLLSWTDGKALIATGSPFGTAAYGDRIYHIAQANNALVFPGLGLGVAVCHASRVTDRMIAAAGEAVASIGVYRREGDALLPSVDNLRMVSARVAMAVAAAAQEEGVAQTPLTDPVQQVFEAMWQPSYPELDIV